MKTKLMQCFAALALLFSASAAEATINCTISSPGFSTNYISTDPNKNITQSSFSVSCVRGSASDPTSTTYSVKADNGLYANGVNNQAASGADRLRYDLFTDNGCVSTSAWKLAVTIPSSAGTITMAGTTPTIVTNNFWGCIASGVANTGNTYTDTVMMTPTYSTGVTGVGNTIQVTINTHPTCSIATIPNITLAYGIAFGSSAVTATTSAPVTCSQNLPYTMAVSPTSGVSAGIYYTLSLPASGTGTGLSQGVTITATAPAGQAGTCAMSSCTGSAQLHTLTVTY